MLVKLDFDIWYENRVLCKAGILKVCSRNSQLNLVSLALDNDKLITAFYR